MRKLHIGLLCATALGNLATFAMLDGASAVESSIWIEMTPAAAELIGIKTDDIPSYEGTTPDYADLKANYVGFAVPKSQLYSTLVTLKALTAAAATSGVDTPADTSGVDTVIHILDAKTVIGEGLLEPASLPEQDVLDETGFIFVQGVQAKLMLDIFPEKIVEFSKLDVAGYFLQLEDAAQPMIDPVVAAEALKSSAGVADSVAG
jgi:hypothetical protein